MAHSFCQKLIYISDKSQAFSDIHMNYQCLMVSKKLSASGRQHASCEALYGQRTVLDETGKVTSAGSGPPALNTLIENILIIFAVLAPLDSRRHFGTSVLSRIPKIDRFGAKTYKSPRLVYLLP
jgi:hypothetical protein